MAFWDLFGGSVVKGISDIATEWIETDKESAEAKAIMVKTLDPNGSMRRDISKKVSSAYMTYLGITALLILAQAFDLGNQVQVKDAIKNLTEHFLPITGMFSSIVAASFGINGLNSHKGN